MIALKGAVPDLLQSPHCAANCLQHVRSSGQGAMVCKSHAALITCNMCATRYEGTGQLLCLNHICFSFISLAEPLTDEGGEETGAAGETPGDELQKKPHTKGVQGHARLDSRKIHTRNLLSQSQYQSLLFVCLTACFLNYSFMYLSLFYYYY